MLLATVGVTIPLKTWSNANFREKKVRMITILDC